MHKTECIDIEPCDLCLTLLCACTIVNINIYGDKGERYILVIYFTTYYYILFYKCI